MGRQEVVIVGGGPAGLSTALHLVAQRPELLDRVVVLERARYPREKFCAGALSARAELDLGSIGVIVDVPAVPVSAIVAEMPNGTVRRGAGPIGRVVRRFEFDAELAAIARRRGVRIVEDAQVKTVVRDGDGVSITSSQGDFQARVVVGADGVGSVVRRGLGPLAGLATWRAQVLEVDTPITSNDGPRDELLFDVRDRAFVGYEWDFPTLVRGEPLVCRGVYALALPGQPLGAVDLAARLETRLTRFGLDLSACKKKRYAERGFAPHEPCAAPHVLLVGEAAGVDPITGEGIAQALLYGHHAADYLVERLASNRLGFEDWSSYLQKTPLGFDLHVRHHLATRFFGPARPFLEDALVSLPGWLELGVRYFGGEKLRARDVWALGLDTARHTFRERERQPLGRLALPITPYS